MRFKPNGFCGTRHEGPRDVFEDERIRSGVVKELLDLGFDRETVVKLTDVAGTQDAAAAVAVACPMHVTGLPDNVAVLRRFLTAHDYVEEHWGKDFYYLCRKPRTAFRSRGQEDVQHRVIWELYEALGIWLEMDRFLFTAHVLGEHYSALLRPRNVSCNIWLMLYHAFGIELGLPHYHEPLGLWRKVLDQVIRWEDIRPFNHRGKLESVLAAEVASLRPLIAPLWRPDDIERVFTVLGRRKWRGLAKVNIEYERGKVPDDITKWGPAIEILSEAERKRPGVGDKALQNIGRWLQKHGRELIDLVTPCGDPLGAREK